MKYAQNKTIRKFLYFFDIHTLYINTCVKIITFLEWLINNNNLLPVYRLITWHSKLHPFYFTIVQIFPLLSLFLFINYRLQFYIVKDLKIAFIADGNRRYLKKMNKDIEQVKEDGLKRIKEIIEFCNQFNIPEVGFYCFSIKNFKRSDKEVQNVLQLLTYNPYITNYKVRVIGNLDLLPPAIGENMRKLEISTKNNTGIIVNLFIAYSTQNEVENGIKFTGEVDLIVRTSGEKRLSDFLILQCCRGTNIFFCDFLWPEITLVHLYLIMLKYKLEQIFFKKVK